MSVTTQQRIDPHKINFTRDDRTGVRDLVNERSQMILDALPRPVEDCQFRDLARAILKRSSRPREENDLDACRAAFSPSMPEGVAALSGLVNASIAQGTESVVDTSEGWTHRTTLQNYLPAKIAVVGDVPRLREVPRGMTAGGTRFSIGTAQNLKLRRFALQFVIDEQDMLAMETVGVQLLALAEVGKAAARLVSDSVYAEILSNPTLEDDSKAVFHADHGNLTTTSLGATGLKVGSAAIENQYLEDQDGAPAHIGQQAKYAIVPPDLKHPARNVARDIALGDDEDLVVRSEPRISATGVRDPRGDTIYTGSATNWLLCADAAQRPSVVVATLEGRNGPRVRDFMLDSGAWGIGFDIQFAVAVSICDYRGLYYSTGDA